MLDTDLVEKRLTEAMLDLGELSIGEQERHRLGLGKHSEDVTVRVGVDDEFIVHWAAGRGRLEGDQLRDYLQETARVGFLARLVRHDDALALTVVDAGSSRISGNAWWTSQTERRIPTQQKTPPKRRTRVASQPFRLRQREDYTWEGHIGFLRDANLLISKAIEEGGWDPAEAVAVRLEGERLATLDQFDELLAIDVANIDHLPHQEAAARTVLARMNGRGILADEVGLGKTIEAGLVLKELLLRGLANRVLILCPAPLRDQWRQELHEKFGEDFTVVTSGKDKAGLGADKVIMTQMLAHRNAQNLKRPFDLVVIDEAHRLAGRGATKTREVLGALVAESPRALLLSATPVQNDLLELYRLVEVLRPGTFRSAREFSNRFMDQSDPRKPVNTAELRKLVSSVIVRTTRQQAGLDRVRRMPPKDVAVTLSGPERQLYDLILDTLRHHMTGPGDVQRRRHLALRLTASPHAVSRMALRMSQAHEDATVRDLLGEIGHLAADIGETERDRKALGLIQHWLDEHGRVLVFSQHTQTVAGLVRVLAKAGITATTFHGDMSHSARANSIAEFRAGKAPVLVSTDAGAEGLNLQVCNCVLNFDLPWNPMRVEQRIGRVHRLTQERDVFIANLFAKNTIDESVYRLLHDKLAMFELLFGQVVTVLGELDDNDQSMEGRVLEALYSDSDRLMQQRLDALGVQLEQARTRAGQMINADSNLSSWLAEQAQTKAARKAPAGEATELMPDRRATERRRQADVERFIRRFLGLAEATITYEAEQFISVKLTPRLSAAFDGLEELHLAFSHRALDVHPEAELCVVGSEFFGLVMTALRDHGDLTGTVQAVPEIHQDPIGEHAPWIRLVSRELRPVQGWSARATYRVQEGTATGKQGIAVVTVGDIPKAKPRNRVAIPDQGRSPAPAEQVLKAIQAEAAEVLDRQRREAQLSRIADGERSRDELVNNLDAQLAEVETEISHTWGGTKLETLYERRSQLKRAIRQTREAAVNRDTIEFRGELLALELHGASELEVVEEWEHRSGTTLAVVQPWPGKLSRFRYRETATELDVSVLGLCARGHVAEASAVQGCEWCAQDSCAACPAEAQAAECVLCGRVACPSCRTSGDLCNECSRPDRAPDLDTEWERGWRFADGAALLVGEQHAVVQRDGASVDVVPDLDVNDPARIRTRSLARRLNLPLGAGLANAASPSCDLTAGSVWSQVEETCWWDSTAHSGASVDAGAVSRLPALAAPDVAGESSVGLNDLLTRLRALEAPPAAPGLRARPLAVVRKVNLIEDEFRFEEWWVQDDEEPVLAASSTATLAVSDHDPVTDGRPLAAGSAGPVPIRIDGIHRSFVVRIGDSSQEATLFIPAQPGDVSLDGERRWARLVRERELPAATVVSLSGGDPAILDPAVAASGTTVQRKTTVGAVLTDGKTEQPASDHDLPTPARTRGLPPNSVLSAAVAVEARALAAALERFTTPHQVVALAPALFVDESWASEFGFAERHYVLAAGTPAAPGELGGRAFVPTGAALLPTLDAAGQATGALTVDSHGHLVEAPTTAHCPVCDQLSCESCGPAAQVGDCNVCGRPTCQTCRTTSTAVSGRTCARCEDYSCHGCSRSLRLTGCLLCLRESCDSCVIDGFCRTCQELTLATPADVDVLPAELRANGMVVHQGRDPNGSMIVLLVGRHRLELALLVDGHIDFWRTLTDDSPYMLRTRLAFAAQGGAGDVGLTILDDPLPGSAPSGLIVSDDTTDELTWVVKAGTRVIAARGDAPRGAEIPPDPTFLGRLLDDLGETRLRIPEPSVGRGAGRAYLAERGLLSTGTAQTVEVEATQRRTRALVVVSLRGLVSWKADGSKTTRQREPWQEPVDAARVEWALHRWNPPPDLYTHVKGFGVGAVIAGIGDHLALGVRAADGSVQWYRLQKSLRDLARLLVGEVLMSRRLFAGIAHAVEPSTITWPSVLGATRVSRHIAPLLREVALTVVADEGQHLRTVLDVHGGGARAAHPSMTDLEDEDLAQSLAALATPSKEEKMYSVGLGVTEEWTTPKGETLTVQYPVTGKQQQALVRDEVTGQYVPAVRWCRNLHLTNALGRCRYCHQETCLKCPDVVELCSVCLIPVCKRCQPPELLGRCTACAALTGLTMFERRRAGLPMTGHAWAGMDLRGHVVASLKKSAWQVTRIFDGEDLSQAVTPAQAAALQAALLHR